MVLAPDPCRRCGKRFEIDSSRYRRQPRTCRDCLGRPGLQKPADPAAMRGIQQALDGMHGAWEDAADPQPQANGTCPGCGAAAEHVTQDLADAGLRQETWRCLADGPRCRPTVKHSKIPTPSREETPMPENLCPCGCKSEVKPDRKFAGRGCALRYNKAHGILGGRNKKGSPQAGEHAPTQPDPPPAGEGEAPDPPPIADLSLELAKSYLRKLTPEARAALLELVAAEDKLAALGVVL